MHQQIIARFMTALEQPMVQHIFRKRLHSVCLVLSPNSAYYFEEDGMQHSASIPSGGTLVNSQQQVIAINHPHFI